MKEIPRNTRHERGVRGCSAGIERCSRSQCRSEKTLGGEAGPLERRGCHAPSSDCTVFRGNYCLRISQATGLMSLAIVLRPSRVASKGILPPPAVGSRTVISSVEQDLLLAVVSQSRSSGPSVYQNALR